jgi:DNA repair protein RadC
MAQPTSNPAGVADLALPFGGFLPRETISPVTDRAADLSDVDLLGRLLRHNGGLAAAYVILDEFTSIQAAVSSSVGDFVHRTGLDASAHQDLQLAHELGLRMGRSPLERKCVLSSWSELVYYLKSRLTHSKTEQFRVVFLNNRNHLIADEMMGAGTINHAPVYPREVIRRALELQASSLLLVHNHPSGDPSPSQADIEITKALISAAATMAIVIHDHVIVAQNDVLSFRSKGLL